MRRLVRPLWLVTRNSAASNDRRCVNYRRAGEQLAARTATAVSGGERGSACVVRFRPEQICAVTDSGSEQQRSVRSISKQHTRPPRPRLRLHEQDGDRNRSSAEPLPSGCMLFWCGLQLQALMALNSMTPRKAVTRRIEQKELYFRVYMYVRGQQLTAWMYFGYVLRPKSQLQFYRAILSRNFIARQNRKCDMRYD